MINRMRPNKAVWPIQRSKLKFLMSQIRIRSEMGRRRTIWMKNKMKKTSNMQQGNLFKLKLRNQRKVKSRLKTKVSHLIFMK